MQPHNMDDQDPPLLTFAGQDFEISVPASVAKAHSPVLAAALTTKNSTIVSVTEFEFATVQCLAQYLKTGNYGVNAGSFPSVISAGTLYPYSPYPLLIIFQLASLFQSTTPEIY
jgi:hypothetical protein